MSQTRVRLSPDTRREQLLDLGVQLLGSRSLDELSIDALAEEAGISRGLLYHYFRNKQEFHRAVVRRAADDLIAVTAPDPDLEPVARLTSALAAYVDYVEANFEPYTSLVRGAASGDQLLREIYEDARTALTGRIFESLAEYGLTDGPAVRLLTNGWAAMVEETVIGWVAAGRQESHEAGTQEAAEPGDVHGAGTQEAAEPGAERLSKQRLLEVLAASLPAVLSCC
ncbi:MAG TPA: TetR/AcrR family transcriptional regulator [Nocardioidaceae bacterium]|nr:TetR/AcrR family transcriptional regulator [Nocardioidaceae bacterium]